eukprot:gene21544-24431_t
MRIITHNMLKCNVCGVESGYPLTIEAEKVEVVECDFNQELVEKILRKTQLSALQSAAKNLKLEGKWLEVADISVETILADNDMLRELHNLLFEIHVQEGSLICPESGRKFPIKDGIPNMLLHEDEV